jgi:hypothetical protein
VMRELANAHGSHGKLAKRLGVSKTQVTHWIGEVVNRELSAERLAKIVAAIWTAPDVRAGSGRRFTMVQRLMASANRGRRTRPFPFNPLDPFDVVPRTPSREQ